MDVMFTCSPDVDQDEFMAVATVEDWRQVLQDLDGIGHSGPTLALIEGLKSWGIN